MKEQEGGDQARHSATITADKKHGGQALSREFPSPCEPRTSPFYQHPFSVKMIMVALQSIASRPEN